MRFFLLFLIFFTISFTAPIDIKLYDTKNNTLYFEEIEKNIEESLKKAQKPSEIIEDEKKYLKILKEANKKTISIEKYTKQIKTSDEAINTLNFLIELNQKEKQQLNYQQKYKKICHILKKELKIF